MAVALKCALIICSIMYAKKQSLMNANSVCYLFHGELANDSTDLSFLLPCGLTDKKKTSLRPRVSFRLRIIAASIV